MTNEELLDADKIRVKNYFSKTKSQGKETDAKLSSFIKKYVEERGGMCDIYKSTGTFRKGKEKVVEKGFYNVTLQQRKSFYSKSNATSGCSDNIIRLISNDGELIVWSCENKLSGDKKSEIQKEYQMKVEQFGRLATKGIAVYSIVSSREDFINQYNKLIQKQTK